MTLIPDKMYMTGLRNKEVLSLTGPHNARASDPAEKESAQIFRLFNPSTKAHLYTKDEAEKESLLASGQWKNEEQDWRAPSISSHLVYRLFNSNSGDHHYNQ